MNAICLATAIVMAACAAISSAYANPPVEAFGGLPDLNYPALSPDGKHFAAIQSFKGKPAAVIYEVGAAPGTPPVVIPSEDATIADLRWAKNNKLIVTVKMSVKAVGDDRLRTWVRALAVNADGSDSVMLLKDSVTIANNPYAANIVDIDLDDPANVFVTLFVPNIVTANYYQHVDDEDYFRLDLLKVNLDTGDGHSFTSGDRTTRDWLMDGHGNVVARIDVTRYPLIEHLKLYDGRSWKDAGAFDATGGHGAGVDGMTEDGKFLVFRSYDTNSMRILTKRSLSDGSETVLYGNPDFDVVDVLKDEWTGRVIGASYIADKFSYVYFDSENRALQRGLEQAFPGKTVHAVSADRAKDRIIVEVSGPRHPTSYYFLDRTTHQASEILQTYPGLTEADLGEVKSYPYSARDGLTIPAYLTFPPGRGTKNLPIVVIPHGGPDSRDYIQFDWWAQLLANRGYAVFQPNFRGSLGYGRKYTEAGLQQWGLKMQDDITDGVKKLIADGVADPKRICIVGASYGGYAALAGATFTPNLYACAMSFAGISDLPEILHTERSDHGAQSEIASFWSSRIGSAYDDSDRLKAASPDRHAEQVRCPVLLMHGEGDTTVRINQSEREYDALKSAGKDVQFIRFAGEDHYLNFSETRIKMLTELDAFLKKNIGS